MVLILIYTRRIKNDLIINFQRVKFHEDTYKFSHKLSPTGISLILYDIHILLIQSYEDYFHI